MKKNKGVIYIYIILLTCLFSILLYFAYSYITKESIINYKREEIINSQYKAESIINILLSDSDFDKEFKDFYLSENDVKNLHPYILPSDTKVERCFIEKSEDNNIRDQVTITAQINYKSIESCVRLIATAINEVYKDTTGVINSSKVNPRNLKLVKEEFSNFQVNNKYNIIYLNGNFIFKKIKSNYFICEEKTLIDETTGSYEIIQEPVYKILNNDIILQERGTLEFKDSNVNAIFLIVNDKVLFNDYNIHGIIVLNEKAQVFESLNLKGYLVDLYDKNTYSNVDYSKNVLNKFKDALPRYVQFEPVALNYFETE